MYNTHNYSVVRQLDNDKYYIMIGPINGYLTGKSDYLYVLLEDVSAIDEIFGLLDSLSENDEVSLTEAFENSEKFNLGENVFVSEDMRDILQLDNEELVLTNVEVISKHNVEYYINKNNLILEFSEPDIRKLYSTFANVILSRADYNNISFALDTSNNAYKAVLQYYANSKTDDASTNIALILGTKIQYNVGNTYSTCGCTSNDSSAQLNAISCFDKYAEGMDIMLATMLSDINFYSDWFLTRDGDDTIIANDVMIDELTTLLEEFLELNLNLSFQDNKYGCQCHFTETPINSDNINIIRNYITILQYVKECQILAKGNTIKVYGELFGQLLPKLDF